MNNLINEVSKIGNFELCNENEIEIAKYVFKEYDEKEEYKYYLYCHINKSNGKKYYGITKNEPKSRWKKGKGYKKSKYFWNAIKKYGWNGFNHIIIFDKLTIDDACSLEKQVIELFETYTDRNKGYNLTSGGKANYTIDYDEIEMLRKPVLQYAKNGQLIYRWDSIMNASKKYSKNNDCSAISRVCNEIRNSAYGYRWKFEKNNKE